MKLFVTDQRELKCGGCNWATSTFYGIGESREKAKSNFEKSRDYGRGVCAECMCDLLIETKSKIIGVR